MASPAAPESLDDLAGDYYLTVLARLHQALQPRTYLELGTNTGNSLAPATCASIAVDPYLALASVEPIANKPFCGLYRMTSDAFFAEVDPSRVFGAPVDFAFLDGPHHCEVLLRDFIGTERHCHAGSVIALHDCLPLEAAMAEREWGHPPARPERADWWTGDCWRTARALKRYRPDLRLTVLNAAGTGLVLVDRLDPASRVLAERYAEIEAAMMAMSLTEIGIARHHADMAPRPTAEFATPEAIRGYFGML